MRRRPSLWAPSNARPQLADGSRFTPGAVLVDGEIVGVWGRRQAQVTVTRWGRSGRAQREAIAAEAESLAGPLGQPVTVDFLTA